MIRFKMRPPGPRSPRVKDLLLGVSQEERSQPTLTLRRKKSVGGAQWTREVVSTDPLWGLSHAWFCSGLGARRVGRRPVRGLDLCAVCPDGAQAWRSLATSGLGTKSLWK